MAKKIAVIHLKEGYGKGDKDGKLFADDIIQSSPEFIVYKKTSKEGRVCEVTVPGAAVARVEAWEADN